MIFLLYLNANQFGSKHEDLIGKPSLPYKRQGRRFNKGQP